MKSAWVLCAVVMIVATLGCASQKKQINLEMKREVVIEPPQISKLATDPAGQLEVGEEGATVVVMMEADAGLKASFDVDGRAKGLPMREESPGVYKGELKVTKGDVSAPPKPLTIVGRVVDDSGRAAQSLALENAVTLVAAPEKLAATSGEGAAAQAGCADGVRSEIGAAVVHFDFGSADLLPPAREALVRVATLLTANPACRPVVVTGHTDLVGEDEYNLNLSHRRAEAVVAFLVEQGLTEAEVQHRGVGKAMPLVNARSREANARNRRVELTSEAR